MVSGKGIKRRRFHDHTGAGLFSFFSPEPAVYRVGTLSFHFLTGTSRNPVNMLFLPVLLFSLVGTAVFVLGGNLGRQLELEELIRDKLVVPDDRGGSNDDLNT